VTAKRCSCPQPLLEHQDDWTLCVVCGREPSIRLPSAISAAERPQTASSRNGDGVRWGGDSSNGLPMTSTRHIGFVAPASMFEELHELAASRERTVSQELRLLIRDHLAEKRSASPTKADASRAVTGSPVGDKA
jgi:hypothetical protein